ncbi:MAG TPA: alkaline phosphatase family protein, partial [Vicinamibacterales bacterium]|nr:alkaline phosphatase family protein [Vicinamibacterales bacterium]
MGLPRRKSLAALLAAISLAGPPLSVVHAGDREDKLQKINHIVVIYQENHSFDNLYGGWEGVRGRADADAAHTAQISQTGQLYDCLMQNDVNLAALPASCTNTHGGSFTSAFINAPFQIDEFIAPTDKTCPAPGVFAANGVLKDSPGALPGGCTRDVVHRFYQEQYQLNGGAMNRYVTGSDAVGLAMGYYDTRSLPIYRYLHAPGHPRYAIADNFFQAAFGGSFLNHQWLVAAASPVFAGAPQSGADDLHSVVDANGFPNNSYPLYHPATAVKDSQLTVKCPSSVAGLACGDFAVNTTQPLFQPFMPGTAMTRRLPALSTPTIGDRLNAAGVDWAWYSGGWSNANGDIGGPGWTNGSGPSCGPATIAGAVFPNCPDKLFQFHHQAFNYYSAFAPGTANRHAHLRDEVEFLELARSSTASRCHLKPVSLVKPIGAENEHPGYTNENTGSDHLVTLIDAITQSACAKDTVIIVTYDEFGGQWDHVAPPGQGNEAGPHDPWGPGTRIPALIVSPFLRGDFVVDHTSYDTTSILATIE